ncbi:MAG: pilus assembly protein PilM [Agathobacter sp.]|nr:pilus assembly protein PilM [Agathobacter sp.]
MSKTVLAFDIGESTMKIAQKSGNGIKVHAVQMPDNLMKDGIVQMPHMLSDFLKEVKRDLSLPGGECGLVVPDELVVCRSLLLPAMTEKQLKVNLPFEFSDYISGEPNKYVYDYALEEMIYDEEGKPLEMKLTGAVMSKESVTGYVNMFKNAGLKLRTLIPQEIALKNMMKAAVESGKAQADKEYCIVNLGHRSTQVYIFKGAEMVVFRTIHLGGQIVDEAIAENENVDVYVARNHKNRNYNKVLDAEYVTDTYGRIAVEVMKVINFYRFNNRESTLEEIYFMGGGSNIPALCSSIAEINEFTQKPMTELLPANVATDTDMIGVIALGVLLQ